MNNFQFSKMFGDCICDDNIWQRNSIKSHYCIIKIISANSVIMIIRVVY